MNDLDFSDKSFNYLPTRIAPALKSSQVKSRKKKYVACSESRFQKIEKRLEQRRLENELRDSFDY